MLQACIENEPMLAELSQIIDDEQQGFAGMKWARMTHRASGRTAMRAQVNVHEPKQKEDTTSALAYTMEGVPAVAMADQAPAGDLMAYSWYPGWNSNQSLHKFQQEVGGSIEGPSTGAKLQLHCHPDNRDGWCDPPKKPRGKADHLLLHPVAQIFGSDELSMKADPVIERCGPAMLQLHSDDAKAHNIQCGDLVQINIEGRHIQLPVLINSQQAKRMALIPDSHPSIQGHHNSGEDIWVTLRSLGPNPVIASDRRTNDV